MKVRDILPLIKDCYSICDKNNNLLFQDDGYYRSIHEAPENVLNSTIDSIQINFAQIVIVIKEN